MCNILLQNQAFRVHIFRHTRCFHALTMNSSRDHIPSCIALTPIQKRHFTKDFYENYLSSNSPPIGLAQSILENIHDITGLPWWASIMVTTIALRTAITLPVAIYSLKNMDKVARLQPELGALSLQLKNEVVRAVKEFKWEYKYARFKYNSTMKKLIKERYIRDNCHPFKSTLVVFLQLPLWFSMSFALRNMSGYVPIQGAGDVIPVPELAEQGILWFSNLAVPDSTWMLPLILGGVNLALTEYNAYKLQNPTKAQKFVTNLFRGLSVLMVPVGATVPACMCLYWTTSSLYGLVQNLALKRPGVRKMFGLMTKPPKPLGKAVKLDVDELHRRR